MLLTFTNGQHFTTYGHEDDDDDRKTNGRHFTTQLKMDMLTLCCSMDVNAVDIDKETALVSYGHADVAVDSERCGRECC